MNIVSDVTGKIVGTVDNGDVTTSDAGLREVVAEIEEVGGLLLLWPSDESTDDLVVDGVRLIPFDDPMFAKALPEYLVKEGYHIVVD